MEKIAPTLSKYALLLSLIYSPLHAHQTPLPLLATGYYFDGLVRRALMIQSVDEGKNWQYPASLHGETLPVGFVDGGLTKSACNHFSCIATGNYFNTDSNPTPLLVQSSSFQSNWSYIDMLGNNMLPTDFYKGWFSDAFCTDTRCFAVGSYDNKKGYRPLLSRQNPKTNQWRSVEFVSPNALPQHFQEGTLETISCDKIHCIAAGTYLDDFEARHPLLIESQDEGTTWKAAKLTQYNDAFVYASACNETQCFAVGMHNDPSSPLLMQHNFDGTWAAAAFELPSDYESGWFNDVDCNSHFCIAVGTYYNGKEHNPLLVFSQDSGAHWALQAPYLPFGESMDGQYTSASCNTLGCLASGYSTSYNGIYPLITVSHNLGTTWEYPASAQVSVPQAELGNGFFRTLTCHEKTCIASGDYSIDSEYFPLLALSLDGGITWDFPSAIMSPDVLPAHFVNGHF